MTSLEILQTLIEIHNDVYTDALIGDDFNYIVWKVLTNKQRQVLFFKIDGLSNKQIGRKMGISELSIKRRIVEIKKLYRNGINDRVDDKVRYWKYLEKNGRLPNTIKGLRKMGFSRGKHK